MKRWLSLLTALTLIASPALAVTPKGEFYQKDSTGSLGSQDKALQETARAGEVATADGSKLETKASHLLLLDYASGTVLAEKAADQRMYPSSMTKMMTLYVVFDKLRQGSLKLDQTFTVSENAWRMQGSKTFVPLGEQVTVEDLIQGIAVQSGNDACVAIAEGIAGSEAAFAGQMNDAAKKLGMNGSHFVDSSGWPNDDHYTTPHDLAVLAAALIRDFPEYYHYFGQIEFSYHGIKQYNRNTLLLNKSLGVDGLKTGHTEAAGYGITLSSIDAETSRRLILVLNGLSSEAERAQEGQHLLTWGERNFDLKELFTPGQVVSKAKVWMGKQDEVALTVKDSVSITIPRIISAAPQVTASYTKPVAAPIVQGQEIGTLTIAYAGRNTEIPLVAATSVEKRGFFGRISGAFANFFGAN